MERRLSRNNLKQLTKKGMAAACIALLAFLFSLQCSIHIWYVGIPNADSGVFRYVARVILGGAMPYKDAFDHKGPLLYLINTAGLLISQWRGLWLIELTSLIAAFALMYRIARLKCGRIGSLAVVLCSVVPLFRYFQGGNLVEEYALPFIAASICIFADYFLNDRINRRRLIFCGFSFAAICLLRINMAAVWLVMCIAVLIQCCMTRQYGRIVFFLGYFLLGFILLTAPVMLWLAAGGAWSAFIEDYFLFNLKYSEQIEHAVGKVFWLFLRERFTLTAFAVSVLAALRKRNIFHCAYAVFMLVSLASIAMSGREYLHYGMIMVPALAYPLACAVSMIEKGTGKKKALGQLAVLVFIGGFALPTWFSAADHGLQAYHTQEEAYVGSSTGKIRNIIRNHTQEEDPIIVCSNWNEIYNLSERFAASRYSYQTPIGQVSQQIMDEFFGELEENKPKAIVLPYNYFDHDRMMAFIDRHQYSRIWQTDDGYAEIYLLNGEGIELPQEE